MKILSLINSNKFVYKIIINDNNRLSQIQYTSDVFQALKITDNFFKFNPSLEKEVRNFVKKQRKTIIQIMDIV